MRYFQNQFIQKLICNLYFTNFEKPCWSDDSKKPMMYLCSHGDVNCMKIIVQKMTPKALKSYVIIYQFYTMFNL